MATVSSRKFADRPTMTSLFHMLRSITLVAALVLGCTHPVIAGAIEKAVEEAGGKTDPSSVYKVALTWYSGKSKTEALEVLHHLADNVEHVMSSVKLGHHYAEIGNNPSAIQYFAKAGEEGPHHSSLFNAGRLLAEQGEWTGALAYLRAAATLSNSYPAEYISQETTQSALEAYDIVSHRLAREELTVVQAADVFIFGSLTDLPQKAQELWIQAVQGLMNFNQTFVDSNGRSQSQEAMIQVAQSLRALWEAYGTTGNLSPLQTYLLLVNINDILSQLAGVDDAYVPMAAGYAEALATHSVYCVEHFAVVEDDSACFNDAAASAMSFYRRAADGESAKRVLQAAQSHSEAATHWKLMEQTPRVYHPDLEAKPWWDETKFSAANTLTKVYQKSKATILKELEDVKTLQEGRLQGVAQAPQTADIDSQGNVEVHQDKTSGFRRIFTPYIGVRTEESETRDTGAGGWAEFGPLFDGITWSAERCKVVPTICKALKNDPSLCTARSSVDSTKSVWQLCGADTVVTILRLRPGTTILPHCGTTNSRLIMHFALEGVDGLEFTVGGKTVNNYKGGEGHAIIFDDSFEHSVYHGGDQDRFVVLAVLAHPDLA